MTRPLKALSVGNFKAFAETQRIPLKPITLIFGPNSAGKSSFLHSLVLAHEAQFSRGKRSLSRLDVHHTEIGGTAIDLGGFRQGGETDHSSSKAGAGSAGNQATGSLTPTASTGSDFPHPAVKRSDAKPSRDFHGPLVFKKSLEGIGRNGKSEAGGGFDRDHSDNPSLLVNKWAAAVTRLDRHGYLDHRATLQLPLLGDHAPRNAIVQPEGVSYGEDMLAGSDHAGISKDQAGRSFSPDLDCNQVGIPVYPDDLFRFKGLSIRQGNRKGPSLADDVAVCDQEISGADEKTTANPGGVTGPVG